MRPLELVLMRQVSVNVSTHKKPGYRASCVFPPSRRFLAGNAPSKCRLPVSLKRLGDSVSTIPVAAAITSVREQVSSRSSGV